MNTDKFLWNDPFRSSDKVPWYTPNNWKQQPEPEPEPVKEPELVKEPEPELVKEPEPELVKEPEPEPELVKEQEQEPELVKEPGKKITVSTFGNTPGLGLALIILLVSFVLILIK